MNSSFEILNSKYLCFVLKMARMTIMLVLGDTNSCLRVIPAKRRQVPIFKKAWKTVVMMEGLEVERARQGLAILITQPRGTGRGVRKVSDYSIPNISDKVVRIIHSYTDYVNLVAWKKY